MSTRTTLVDRRALELVLPALDMPDEILTEHLRRQEPIHRALRAVLACPRLDEISQQDWDRFLSGKTKVTPSGIVVPQARLAKTEPIRKQFPDGWYFVCPAGVDLRDLNQNAFQFNARFYGEVTPWFLESYGNWPDCSVEHLPTESLEVFIPDPTEWVLPGSKNQSRDKTLQLGAEFGRTLPEGWSWEEPTIETLVLAAFAYHAQTGEYPLSGYNYARCRNRYGAGRWLVGGDFGDGGFCVRGWLADPGVDLGGLHWAIRRGRVGKKER